MKKPTSPPQKKYSIWTGNAGEHLVMAELLARGFDAFMADRNNRAFDIAAHKNGRHALIRVKTTTGRNLQWSCKKTGEVFLNMLKKNDFVVAVILNRGSVPQNIEKAEFYIVPTHVVDRDLRKSFEHWHKFTRRDGKKRKITSHRSLGLFGNDTKGNIARGFADKWKKYKSNWDLLCEA